MRLLSTPLEPRNRQWAAKWNSLPPAWRQAGCKAVAPTGPAKPPAKRTAPARRTAKRQPARKPTPRGGILARLFRR
jgi:hypothetical protein